jgi:hypothetical protein
MAARQLRGSRMRRILRWSFGTLVVTVASAAAALALKFNTAVLGFIESARHLLMP